MQKFIPYAIYALAAYFFDKVIALAGALVVAVIGLVSSFFGYKPSFKDTDSILYFIICILAAFLGAVVVKSISETISKTKTTIPMLICPSIIAVYLLYSYYNEGTTLFVTARNFICYAIFIFIAYKNINENTED